MKIKTILRTTTYHPKDGNKEDIIKEELLSEYETSSEIANGMLNLLTSNNSYSEFNKDDELEFCGSISYDGRNCQEKELIIKFVK